MSDLFRDTIVGKVLRIISRGKLYRFAEERDPSLWQRYVHHDKTQEMASHGRLLEDHENQSAEDGTSGSEKEATRPANDVPEPTAASHESSRTRALGENDRVEEHLKTNVFGHVVDPEKGRDINVVEWYGSDDPENPMNWSRAKKFLVTFFICQLTFSIYIGSAIYTPGEETIVQGFGVSQEKATLGLTLFVAGYGLGPMIFAPMSEIPQIGRNPVYIGTLFFFVILQLPIALAPNFATILVFRFITGFLGSPVLATGGASIADMYTPKKRAYAISLWGLSAVCGPSMGPVLGGFAAQHEGWSWTIWELMWLSGFSFIMLLFVLPETSSANILYRRARRLRKVAGNERLKAAPEIASEAMTRNEIIQMTLVRPFTLSFTEPMVFLLNLYIALIYGLLYIWFESFPIVFTGIYNFNLSEEGLSFIGILLGAAFTLPPFFWYLYNKVEPKFNENGDIRPEDRLPPAFVGAFAIPICLFMFGWSARPSIHWVVPIIGSGFFSVGALLLFNSVLNYLGDAYPDYAASVLAGNDLFRSSFGAGFPLFATAMYDYLGVGWASSTLGFLSIAFIPIPFVLFIYGERLRRVSRYARKDF